MPDVRNQREVWVRVHHRTCSKTNKEDQDSGERVWSTSGSGPTRLTLGHEGLSQLEVCAALLEEALRHPVGPRGGQGVLRGLVVLP